MKRLALGLFIGALGCTSTTYNVTNSVTPRASSTPPVESAPPKADPAPVASSAPVPTTAPPASAESPKAATPPVPTPPAAASAPATSPEGFKAKVEAKCLVKHPEGKLRYKACVALQMGAVRAACRMATGKDPEGLCEKNPKYCTPEVQDMIYEGLSFCDTFAKEKEE